MAKFSGKVIWKDRVAAWLRTSYLAGRSNPETEWFDRELSYRRFGLTDVILCEILQGTGGDAVFRQVLRELEPFEIFTTGRQDLAIATAKNYQILRGITVRKTIDCLIATFCLSENYSLLHRDREFNAFEKRLDLRVIHP